MSIIYPRYEESGSNRLCGVPRKFWGLDPETGELQFNKKSTRLLLSLVHAARPEHTTASVQDEVIFVQPELREINRCSALDGLSGYIRPDGTVWVKLEHWEHPPRGWTLVGRFPRKGMDLTPWTGSNESWLYQEEMNGRPTKKWWDELRSKIAGVLGVQTPKAAKLPTVHADESAWSNGWWLTIELDKSGDLSMYVDWSADWTGNRRSEVVRFAGKHRLYRYQLTLPLGL